MVYFKVLLDSKRKKSDSIYPVVIRLTFNRVSTTITTGIKLHEEHWDVELCKIKSIVPNGQMLNNKIANLYTKIERLALSLEEEGIFSFEELKNQLNPSTKVRKEINVNEFALLTINNLMREGKTGNALVYQAAWNRFSAFVKTKELKFSQITSNLINEFKRNLIKEEVKINSISNYLRTIRALYNRAVNSELVDGSRYPFKNIKIESEPTLKRAIPFSELKKLLNDRIAIRNNEWHSVNYFFLSVSLIGISFVDLAYLKKTDVVDDRIVYIRRKTKKVYSIKLTELSNSILQHYTSKNNKYLLPILDEDTIENSIEAYKIIKQWIKTTNHYLNKLSKQKGIGKVTTYVARHSWATTAKRLGYSNEVIAEALGHEYGNRVTNTYLDSFESSIIDGINESILKHLE